MSDRVPDYKKRAVPVYVYAIQPVGIERVKVGITDNLERRALQLLSFSPVPLVWRRVLMVFGRGTAHVWEKTILGWSTVGGGFGEWRNDIDLVDSLMSEIAPAIDCTDEAPEIASDRMSRTALIYPDQVQARIEYASFIDEFDGWHFQAHDAIGISSSPLSGEISQPTLDKIRAYRAAQGEAA